MKKFIILCSIAVIALVSAGTINQMLSDAASLISEPAREALVKQSKYPGSKILSSRAKSMLSGDFTLLVLRIDAQNNLMIGNAPYAPEAFDKALDRVIGSLPQGGAWADKLVLVVEVDPISEFSLVEKMFKAGMTRGIKMISGYTAGGSWHHIDLSEQLKEEQDKILFEGVEDENSN